MNYAAWQFCCIAPALSLFCQSREGCYCCFLMCGLRYIPASLSSFSLCADAAVKSHFQLTLVFASRRCLPAGTEVSLSGCSTGLWDAPRFLRDRRPRLHSCHRAQADDYSKPASSHRHQEIHQQGPSSAVPHPSHSSGHAEASTSPSFLYHRVHSQPAGIQRAGENGSAQPSLPAVRPSARSVHQPRSKPALWTAADSPPRASPVRSIPAPGPGVRIRSPARASVRVWLRLRGTPGALPRPLLRRGPCLRRKKQLRAALCSPKHLEARAGVSRSQHHGPDPRGDVPAAWHKEDLHHRSSPGTAAATLASKGKRRIKTATPWPRAQTEWLSLGN